MLAYSDRIFPAQKANSTNITKYNLCQPPIDQEDLSLEKKVSKYFQEHPETLKSLQKSEIDHIASLPLKKRYKARRWKGHAYGVRLIVHTAYLIQSYYFAYGVEGKAIRPSKATLAEELGICIRTLDKALKILRDMEVASWKSGKPNWETNTYYLANVYKSTPMRKPHDFRHPRHLWLKQQYLIKKQKLKNFTRTLYEHSLGDIADHLLCRNKNLRTSLKKSSKNIFKTSKDPPKPRKIPPNYHLLKDLNLSFKDQWVLSRYSEHLLRMAIDDLCSYRSWNKEIKNVAAFLMSRCKEHEKQANSKKQNPLDVKEWLTTYFKSRKARFLFITRINQIDRSASESRPFIQLLWHKQEFQKSMLKIYQKVEGTWIEKVFKFDRPDLAEAVEAYLENSIRRAFLKT